jgi:mevalonate kinase
VPLEEITVSAPGSLMLMGEHAVLHGRRALVAAINRRVRVRLTPRADRQIRIRSALGALDTTLDTLVVQPPFTFVLATLQKFRRQISCGLDLTIESEFSHEIGFGSSAAVTVALLGTLTRCFRLFRPTYHEESWLRAAISIIRAVQGCGSGADAAASLCGGVVLYRAAPLEFHSLYEVTPRLTAVYAGYKTKTADVIAHVKRGQAFNPRIFNSIYDLMDMCVARAVPFFKRNDWGMAGELMNIHHGLQTALGTNTPELEEIRTLLRQAGGIAGAKISGSGLGDCAVGLGWPDTELAPYSTYRLQVPRSGASLEFDDEEPARAT